MPPAKRTACRWNRNFHDHLEKEERVHHVEDSPNIPEEMRGRHGKDVIHTSKIIAHPPKAIRGKMRASILHDRVPHAGRNPAAIHERRKEDEENYRRGIHNR